MSDTARQRIPVPADVELPDKLVAGLTGRQVVITAIAVLVIWAGFEATRRVLPLPVFAVLAAPVAVIAAALATGQRDGLTLDRLLAAAWRQARSPRRMVTAPEGVPAVPGWVAPGLARQAGPALAPVTPPWQLVTPDGVIGLGGDGAAAVCAVSTVNFALRSPAEQNALTVAYGRWLHSLTGPVQILIRTGHSDLASAVSRLREDAPSLPHPALEQAALGHADFLAGLGAARQVLTRQVLLVIREAGRGAPAGPAARPGGPRSAPPRPPGCWPAPTCRPGRWTAPRSPRCWPPRATLAARTARSAWPRPALSPGAAMLPRRCRCRAARPAPGRTILARLAPRNSSGSRPISLSSSRAPVSRGLRFLM